MNISEDEEQSEDESQIRQNSYSPVMICDKQRIMQVLLNMQSNALKFTEKGHVKIEVSVEKKYGNNYLKIEVIDTGIGIKMEDQDKLF